MQADGNATLASHAHWIASPILGRTTETFPEESAAIAVLQDCKAIVSIDRRFDYGEIRHVAMAPMRGRLYVICYQLRGRKRRIISFRKANRREERIYAKAIADR
jgi:uncharacterized DUF497 family protein